MRRRRIIKPLDVDSSILDTKVDTKRFEAVVAKLLSTPPLSKAAISDRHQRELQRLKAKFTR